MPSAASQFSKCQCIGISRIIHIQHGGAVAFDGDSLGLGRIVGEMLGISACEILILIIAALLLGTGLYIGGLIRSGYTVAVVIGVLVPEYDSKAGLAGCPLRLMGGVFCRNGCRQSSNGS